MTRDPIPARAPVISEPEPRAICERCWRPEVVCYCRFVTPVPTRTRVVIFQHRRERDVPINTARIASLCLPSSELHVGVTFSGTTALRTLLADRERPPVLLYPGPGAIDIETSPPDGPVTLVVLDGTWSQAKKLLRVNPELAALPRYAFRPPSPSDYRIRSEPREDYVSTLEAIVHVLSVLEGGDARVDALLEPFRAMVAMQVAYRESEHARHRHGPAREKRRRFKVDPVMRLPSPLRERPDDLLFVFGEANGWPYGTKERALSPEELVHWTAHRATGETFSAFLAPRGRLSPATPGHVGVPAADLLAGLSLAAFCEAWSAFVRPSDVLVGWGNYPTRLFTEAFGPLLPETRVDLRLATRSHAASRVGTMEEYLAAKCLPAPAPLTVGRAGARLAEMVAIARHLTRT